MKIKLIIWDLDNTLWSGILAEGEAVTPYHHRLDIIRTLNQHGIISSICSKNAKETAQQKLLDLNMENEFVFPRFEFAPKAHIIQQLIADMQLRPENVLFIDDDIHNLEEARHLLPDLNIVDSTQPTCDALLADILKANAHVSKNRIEEYRMLERKVVDRQQQPSSNEDFLRSCDIHVAVVHMRDNMQFGARIEELINRSNQLNYTKSRVEEGSIADLMATSGLHYGFSLFVWDKYGYHGLVGFADAANGQKVRHFVFSCRIMNMQIENWFLNYIVEFHKTKSSSVDISDIPVVPRNVDWIREESFRDPAVQAMIWKKEIEKSAMDIELRVMALCASGALAHYSGLGNRVDHDGMDRDFSISLFLNEKFREQSYPSLLIYTASSDYDENIWEPLNASQRFEECAINFCNFLHATNKKILIILTPQNLPPEKILSNRRANQARMTYCNDIWRKMAKIYEEITLLEVNDIATHNEVIDNYHFDVPLLKKLGEYIRIWFDQKQSTQNGRTDVPILRLM